MILSNYIVVKGELFSSVVKKAALREQSGFFGGQWRIRTAVEAFAEPCLASRPTDRSLNGLQI